jgi:hypothetical protein
MAEIAQYKNILEFTANAKLYNIKTKLQSIYINTNFVCSKSKIALNSTTIIHFQKDTSNDWPIIKNFIEFSINIFSEQQFNFFVKLKAVWIYVKP